MRCYYEVLNVPRDVEDADIKSAYKKLALRWHPDKNLSNPDEAKEQFQLVQQAYEVLSDRQERAWYDNHREQILHGSNKDFEDNCLDVFQYFTSSCYKGFGDDDAGFYTVYRNVFEQIAKEDMEHMDNKEEFTTIPMFGSAESDYEMFVRPFYAYWMSYSTKRSYVWLDPYDIKETRERRIIKLIEKENKKVRAKAKKERNDEVRNLVAFVRKRDKRVQANVKFLEQKAKENKLKAAEQASQARRERRAESKKEVQGEWSKFDNVQEELANIEKQLAEEFDDKDESEEELDDLYCVACNKVFKTPKAFANHESSKKHKENIERLREEMLEEDEEFETIDDEEDLSNDGSLMDAELKSDNSEHAAVKSDGVTNGNLSNGNLSDLNSEELEELEEEVIKTKKKKNKKSKQIRTIQINSDDESVDLSDLETARKQNENQSYRSRIIQNRNTTKFRRKSYCRRTRW
ncbi:dnaJ homolog subfamily C member 21-like [Atheta coriaria]|uniref:dnaJ homolog subfamily C member 21-like n=1 Tax=Dalotia coriaria TaxID=877792 RepID=UPI0031F3D67F